jgi:hypothetical protein
MRRRRNHGQAGGGTSLAVERVDGSGAPAGDTSGVDLASETKKSVVSPQHANPKQTDDASTLAKDLLGESRLEGVNRAKLKFTKLITTTSRVSVRNRNESEREGVKQIASE